MDNENEPRVWYLGDDYDCETCGYTWNMLRFEQYDDETNLWVLSMSVGCYDGDSVGTDDENFASRVEEIIDWALRYEGFGDEDAKGVREVVAQVTGEKS